MPTQRDHITIELPWPDNRLHAHNKGHWRVKSDPVKQARRSAYLIALSAKPDSHKPFERAKITYVFHMPNARNRDIANLIQSCKPYLDGIVDAGIIKDDNWKCLCEIEADAEVNSEFPCVEMTFVNLSHGSSDTTSTRRE
ncbi:MAG: RusA family crossover junction endodeoxyribonuclease [Phycisphaeraceae bacterium]|nr:RusA family crossover junction endodeoxyribonuclease [Phycisphaerales bacterium]MCB9858864.1 RusA family crossover junction endodeoxyribonuclease [Phycisphaeraceae bacterium]